MTRATDPVGQAAWAVRQWLLPMYVALEGAEREGQAEARIASCREALEIWPRIARAVSELQTAAPNSATAGQEAHDDLHHMATHIQERGIST